MIERSMLETKRLVATRKRIKEYEELCTIISFSFEEKCPCVKEPEKLDCKLCRGLGMKPTYEGRALLRMVRRYAEIPTEDL